MTTTKATRARRRSPKAGAMSAPFAGTVGISRQLDALLKAFAEQVLTEDEYEAKRAPLVKALHESAAADVDRMSSLGPLGVTIGTTVVVTGEPIETAWGNQVRADLLALNTGKAELTGATFTGHVLGITPTSAAHLTRKDYVDGLDSANDAAIALRALKSGDTFSGTIQVGGNSETPVAGFRARIDGAAISAITNAGGSSVSTANATWHRQDLGAGQPGDVGGVFHSFRRGGTQIGAIDIAAGPTTRFLTSSDPRLKEAGRAILHALSSLRSMAPILAKFKGDEAEQFMWDAERVLAVMAHGVVHGKAGAKLTAAKVKAQGWGRPGDIDPLLMDYGRTTPLLGAAILELEDRVTKLEKRKAA